MQTITKPAQHTPGPWAYKFSQPTGTLQIKSVGEPIAHCYGPDRSENKPYFTERGAKTIFGADCERSEANARLIAAAPELLSACEVVILNFDFTPGRVAISAEAWHAIRAAVAKAKSL